MKYLILIVSIIFISTPTYSDDTKIEDSNSLITAYNDIKSKDEEKVISALEKLLDIDYSKELFVKVNKSKLKIIQVQISNMLKKSNDKVKNLLLEVYITILESSFNDLKTLYYSHIPVLMDILKDKNDYSAYLSATALSLIGKQILPHLERMILSEDLSIDSLARIEIAVNFIGEDALPTVSRWLNHDNKYLRITAYRSYGSIYLAMLDNTAPTLEFYKYFTKTYLPKAIKILNKSDIEEKSAILYSINQIARGLAQYYSANANADEIKLSFKKLLPILIKNLDTKDESLSENTFLLLWRLSDLSSDLDILKYYLNIFPTLKDKVNNDKLPESLYSARIIFVLSANINQDKIADFLSPIETICWKWQKNIDDRLRSIGAKVLLKLGYSEDDIILARTDRYFNTPESMPQYEEQ